MMESLHHSERFMKLKNMILNFRVAELQTLLQRAQKNKTGKKNILQERALALLGSMNEEMIQLIYELHRQRFSSVKSFNVSNIQIEQNLARPFQGISARSTGINHHPTTNKRGPHPYAIFESPKFRPMKGMEPRPYFQNNLYFPSAVQGFPYPPSYQALPKNIECPKLKPSSFSDVLTTIEKQHIFEPHHVPKREEVEYKFRFGLDDVNKISKTREHCEETKSYKGGNIMQLRISKVNEPDDFLPVTLSVNLNGRPLPLPNLVPVGKSSGLMKRPCVPLDMTGHVHLTPNSNNVLTITWDKEDHRNYPCILGLSIYIVKQVTADTLVERLNARSAISEQESMAFVLKKFEEAADDDIATTTIRASFICPLGKMIIRKPCRSMLCTHVQCFDGETFIKMNEKKASWICPICDRTLTFFDIQVDELWLKILNNVPDDCREVEFSSDGSWNFVRPEPKKISVFKKRNKGPEVFTIDTDSEDECVNLEQKDNFFPMHVDISDDDIDCDDDDDDITCLYISQSISKSMCSSFMPTLLDDFDPGASTSGISTSVPDSFNLNLYEIANSETRHSISEQTGIQSVITCLLSDDDD